MNIKYTSENEKPSDWPANEHEYMLDQVFDCAKSFQKNPSYRTRDVLLSLISQHDFNQSVGLGWVRVTEYEAALINSLYIVGTTHNINSLKTFLYDVITQVTRLHKMASWCMRATGCEESPQIPAYEKVLLLPLKLYYFAYQKFTIEKEKSFAEQLVEIVEFLANSSQHKDEINQVVYAYSAMLSDISHMHGRKREKLWEFSREELFKLLKIEAKLLKLNGQAANSRPTKGILMIQISNFILKSRHEYNDDYICKYLPVDVARSSIVNHQIWMKRTEFLNDAREQRVIQKLFTDSTWIDYEWAKNIDFTATRTYYVSSFSKSINSDDMNSNYGSCLYGYKNDSIAELIAPIQIQRLTKNAGASADLPDSIERPYVSQVVAFDVLYDIQEAKRELKYLFKVIDMFDLSADDKTHFLQEIMQYWILSVKDSAWKSERERRYVLFLYDDYEYIETEFDDTFLKVKTSLFLTPDFILGENPSRREIKRMLAEKRSALYSREYLFCEDCLMQDHDILICQNPTKCPICGSENIRFIRHQTED